MSLRCAFNKARLGRDQGLPKEKTEKKVGYWHRSRGALVKILKAHQSRAKEGLIHIKTSNTLYHEGMVYIIRYVLPKPEVFAAWPQTKRKVYRHQHAHRSSALEFSEAYLCQYPQIF